MKFKIKKTLKISEVKNMESGIIPAIISFFFPGIGQALTDGKPTGTSQQANGFYYSSS